MLRMLYCYRFFILSSIKNSLRDQYVRSKLGFLWMILGPLVQVLIYALILSNILSAKLPGMDNQYAYTIYLVSGLLVWNLFNEIVTRCLTLFIDSKPLLQKISFPLLSLPIIVSGSALINNVILFILMICILTLLGVSFTWHILWVIPLMVLSIMLSVSLGMIAGILNVFFRDVGPAVPILLQIWFWGTPLVYPISIIPEQYAIWFNLNPLYGLVEAYRDVIIYGRSINISDLWIPLAYTSFLLCCVCLIFKPASKEMVDVL